MSNEIDKDKMTESEAECAQLDDTRSNEFDNNVLVQNEEDLGTHNRPKLIRIVKMVKTCKKRKKTEESKNQKKTLSFRFYWREGCKNELFYGYRKRLKDQDGKYKARVYCNMQKGPTGQTHCLVSFIAKCSCLDEDSNEFIDPKNWEIEVNIDQPLHQYIRYNFF